MPLIVHDTALPEGCSALLSFTLVDEYGVPIQANLTTLTLTYYDQRTEEILNNRDQQNVLNTNNVTFGEEALGTISCTFIGTSKIIRRLSGSWLASPVQVGSQILIAGTASNNALFTVTSRNATDLVVSEVVIGEVGVDADISLPGRVIWTLQPDDTSILDIRREIEKRIALFVWTWASGAKSGSQEIQISIENLSHYP